MVFPPVVNIGFPTMGHSWFTNRSAAMELASSLGIRTIFDRTTPVAPYGTMFWAGRRRWPSSPSTDFTYEDFASEDAGWDDGMLGHVLERLYGYTVLDAGHTSPLVLNTDWAAINYAFLEYKLQRISSMLPAYTQDQVDCIEHITDRGPPLVHLKKARRRFLRRVWARPSARSTARPGRTARGASADAGTASDCSGMALTLEKAFNPRHNSIGFLRWLMAFAVIFSHAGPLAGLLRQQEPRHPVVGRAVVRRRRGGRVLLPQRVPDHQEPDGPIDHLPVLLARVRCASSRRSGRRCCSPRSSWRPSPSGTSTARSGATSARRKSRR